MYTGTLATNLISTGAQVKLGFEAGKEIPARPVAESR